MMTETESSTAAANCALARRFFAEQDRLKVTTLFGMFDEAGLLRQVGVRAQ